MTKQLKRRVLAGAATMAVSVLAGCGGSDTAAKKAPMPVEETVYGDQFKQMNRVREETSKLSGERMDTLNKQLEGQETEPKEDTVR